MAVVAVVGCSGAHAARTAPTTTTRTRGPLMPARLARPLTLNRTLHFLPPRPGDTTRLPASRFARPAAMPFPGSGEPIAGPTVVLARYTDDFAKLSPTVPGHLRAGYRPHTFDHDLVVVVLAYGPVFPVSGPPGSTGPLRQSNETVVWTYDAVNGKALIGNSFPGRLPPIATAPATPAS
jgi:hypothetical protein